MSAHKFQLGQTVAVLSRRPACEEPEGGFVITQRFCHRGELYYCVKSPREPYERSLPEGRLRAAAALSERRDRLRPSAITSPPLH